MAPNVPTPGRLGKLKTIVAEPIKACSDEFGQEQIAFPANWLGTRGTTLAFEATPKSFRMHETDICTMRHPEAKRRVQPSSHCSTLAPICSALSIGNRRDNVRAQGMRCDNALRSEPLVRTRVGDDDRNATVRPKGDRSQRGSGGHVLCVCVSSHTPKLVAPCGEI